MNRFQLSNDVSSVCVCVCRCGRDGRTARDGGRRRENNLFMIVSWQICTYLFICICLCPCLLIVKCQSDCKSNNLTVLTVWHLSRSIFPLLVVIPVVLHSVEFRNLFIKANSFSVCVCGWVGGCVWCMRPCVTEFMLYDWCKTPMLLYFASIG